MADLLLHLSLIPGVGPAFLKRVLTRFSPQGLDDLYQCDVADLLSFGFSHALAQAVVAGLKDKALLEQEKALVLKNGFSVVGCTDEAYPELMRHMHAPPLVLYVRGTLPTHYEKSIALVGSRAASEYGRQVVAALVPELVARQWLVVSGGALGIDAAAHQETLKAQGVTVAIIGSGLLRPYPASNRRLFDAIVAQGGAVVSPFSLNAEGLPGNFPARNQLIAGMTRGCIVVQAAAKSGALITAHAAVREGREVGAVPGSLFDPLSAGCHALLQEGAALIRSVNDIEQLFGYTQQTREIGVAHLSSVAAATVRDPLMAFCVQPRSLDELIVHAGCSLDELHGRIWDLQVAGCLEEVSAGKWQVTRS